MTFYQFQITFEHVSTELDLNIIAEIHQDRW